MIPTPRRAARTVATPLLLVLAASAGACTPDAPADAEAAAGGEAERGVLALWERGDPAFGVYVPDERPRGDGPRGEGPRPAPLYTEEGGRRLAENPLVDFAFLNLEGAFDVDAVRAISTGMASAGGDAPTLLVRIPSIASAGVEATRERVREVLALGADGVVLPHVRSADEARTAVGFFAEAGADVWSPSNPGGDVVAMLMVEDPDAVAEVEEIADIPGYSVLACGIGSLTRAMGGDREAAEAGCREVLAHATRAGKADMMTADAESVAARVEEGYLALLLQGPEADSITRLGRAAAGR